MSRLDLRGLLLVSMRLLKFKKLFFTVTFILFIEAGSVLLSSLTSMEGTTVLTTSSSTWLFFWGFLADIARVASLIL